jgi:hypothetical protein
MVIVDPIITGKERSQEVEMKRERAMKSEFREIENGILLAT